MITIGAKKFKYPVCGCSVYGTGITWGSPYGGVSVISWNFNPILCFSTAIIP